MKFDVKLHIDSQSPEGQVLQSIVSRDHVSVDEAVLRALRHPALVTPTPAEEMIGAFSSPEDVAILDEAMVYVRELRESDKLREFEP